MAKLNNKKKRGEDATAASNFTEDILLELLSWLPVKSLLRFRCVCKSWCALIDRPDFVKMHLTRSIAACNNLSIVSVGEDDREDYREDVVKVTSVGLDDCEYRGEGAIRVEFYYRTREHEIESKFGCCLLTSCNGLVYMIHDYDPNDTRIPTFLFNPSTRTHKELPCPEIDFPSAIADADQTGYGLGYDPTTDDYLVIRVVIIAVDDDEYNGFHMMVYSLSSNSWRIIEGIPQFDIQNPVGVFTNSAFHWVSSGPVIVAIDIRDDERREVPLPNLVEDELREVPLSDDLEDDDLVEDKFYITIGVLGEKNQLCMLCHFSKVRVEFWVMKDYGVRDSWEKQFIIEQPLVLGNSLNYIMPMCYSKKGEVLLRIGQGSEGISGNMVLYDAHKGRANHLRFRYQMEAVYIGSLISLDTKGGVDKKRKKRKKQRLEKCGKEIRRANLLDPSRKKPRADPREGTSQMAQEEGYTAESPALPNFVPQWNLTEKSSVINDPFVSQVWPMLAQLPIDCKAMAEFDDKKFTDSAFCAMARLFPFFVEAINRASRSSTEASTYLNKITEQHTEIERLHDSVKKLMVEVDGLKKEKDACVQMENLIRKERNEAQSEAQKAKGETAHVRDEAARAWEEVVTAREEASKYAKEQANLKRELSLLQSAWEDAIEKAKAHAVAENLESLELGKLATSYDVRAFKLGLKDMWIKFLQDYPDLDTSKYTTCCDPAIYDGLGMERPSSIPPKPIPEVEGVGKEKGKEEDKVDEVGEGFQDVANNGV